MAKLKNTARRMGMVEETPLTILADVLEEKGDPQAVILRHLERYVALVEKLLVETYNRYLGPVPQVIVHDRGPVYWRIVTRRYHGHASVHTFVRKSDGAIFKGTWSAPVKNGLRGNITMSEEELRTHINEYGPVYLK